MSSVTQRRRVRSLTPAWVATSSADTPTWAALWQETTRSRRASSRAFWGLEVAALVEVDFVEVFLGDSRFGLAARWHRRLLYSVVGHRV